MPSYQVDSRGQDEQLDAARFPTIEQAQEVATATEHAGDGYIVPRVVESADEPNTTAADFMAAVWSDYPGPCPEGIDPADWFAQ